MRAPDSAAGAAPDSPRAASTWGAPTVAAVDGELARGEVGSAIEADDLADDAAELSAGTAVRPVSVSRLRRFKSLRKSEACW